MRKKRYFQWIDGEMKGDIVILESIEEFESETFYHFDDGEACNLRFIAPMTNTIADLKGKFMVEIESPSNAWTFEVIQPKKYRDESMKGEEFDIPSMHDILKASGNNPNIDDSDIGKEKLVPPRYEQHMIPLPSIEEYRVVQKTTQLKQNAIPEAKPKEEPQPEVQVEPKIDPSKQEPKLVNNGTYSNDPVKILVDTCKKYPTPVDMTIHVMLPSKSIADIASSEFENGFDKFVECIVNDIDASMIISELRHALKAAYSVSEN